MSTMQRELSGLKKVWAVKRFALPVIIISVLILSSSAFSSQITPKNDAKPHKDLQTMTYDVYAGGFHVVNAKLDVDFTTPERYRLELFAHTRGFLGKLAPWSGTFETHGWYNKKTKNAQPELHQSTTTWQDEVEVKEYKYGKDGSFKEYRITDEHSKREKRDVPAELTKDTTDALTATLAVMQAFADEHKCEGSDEVFDGKRRYRLVFQHQKDVELQSSRYNIYGGKAAECVVEVQPRGGKWHKKPRGWMSIQEQGRERGTMPTVWMAKMRDDAPAVPVKIRVKTEYGVLFMHLTRYQNGETSLVAAKAK